ncbi:MAG: Fic family protein [Spirochaetota bacterium]|nr:Fic family protein [Spirochaetota bacterium]
MTAKDNSQNPINHSEPLMQKVRALKSEINTYHSLPANQLLLVRKKYFTQVLYHSMLTQNKSFSMSDLEDIIFRDKVSGQLSFSAYQKIHRQVKALFYVEKEANKPENPLSVQLIQKLFLLLFWGDDIIEDGSFALPYRETMALHNEDSFRLSLSPVSEIPYRLERLIKEYLTKEESDQPFLSAAMFQFRFLEISPYQQGNEDISFYLFQLLVMIAGLPPMIFTESQKDEYYKLLKSAEKDEFQTLHHKLLGWATQSMEHILSLLKQAKNREQISSAGYFTSLIQEIKSTDREIGRFQYQNKVDQAGVQKILERLETISGQYFIEHPLDDLQVLTHRIYFREILLAHLIQDYFIKEQMNLIWKTEPGPTKNSVIYRDDFPSVFAIEIKTDEIHIPNSNIYFALAPTRESNYLFSIQISTYLDFRKAERFPNNLSYFRLEKLGSQLHLVDDTVLTDFFNLSMGEFFDQMTEKVTERKRILKQII